MASLALKAIEKIKEESEGIEIAAIIEYIDAIFNAAPSASSRPQTNAQAEVA